MLSYGMGLRQAYESAVSGQTEDSATLVPAPAVDVPAPAAGAAAANRARLRELRAKWVRPRPAKWWRSLTPEQRLEHLAKMQAGRRYRKAAALAEAQATAERPPLTAAERGDLATTCTARIPWGEGTAACGEPLPCSEHE